MFGFTYGDGVTLVHFQAQSPRLYTAGDSLNCQYIRAYFKQRGGNAAQYIEAHLATLQDCAEEIESFGSAVVAVQVEAETYSLCRSLSRTLKQLDSELRIVWFGEWVGKLHGSDPQEVDADAFILAEPEATIWMLSESDKECWENSGCLQLAGSIREEAVRISGIDKDAVESDTLTLDLLASPDERKGAAVEFKVRWADRQGETVRNGGIRRHSMQRFAEEAAKAAKTAAGTTLSIEGFEYANAPEELARGFEIIAAHAPTVKLEVGLRIDQLHAMAPGQLEAAGISALKLTICSPDSLKDAAIKGLLTQWRAGTAGARIRLWLDGEMAGQGMETARHLKSWLSAGLIQPGDVRIRVNGLQQLNLESELADLLASAGSGSDPALLNGYLAYKTGQYPPQALGSGVKHIGLSDRHIPDLAELEPNQLMGINSAFILSQNSVSSSEKEDKYLDAEGVVKRDRTGYNRLAKELESKHQYVPHIQAESLTADTQTRHLEMSAYDFGPPIEMELMNYREAAGREIEDQSGVPGLEILEVGDADNLQAFLEDVQAFEQVGKFRHGYQVRGYVTDSCRWSAAGQCPIKQLPRLSIEEEGKIAGCGGCAAIGRVGDSYDSLQREASAASTREQLLRGCDTCEIRDTCSKCTFLPEYMTRSQYCEIRKRHAMLHRYMQVAQVFKGLRQYTVLFRDTDIREVGVSLRTCTHLLPAAYQAEGQSWVPDHLFVLFVGGQPLLYQAASGKLLKLSPLMALVLEAGIKGLSEVSLKRAIAEVFKTDETQAETAAEQVSRKLDEMGIISAARRAS
ncbi:hypothetical protein [Saccharibacillus kuerlensis]|uniref:Uncharacterized protein n=1 Tax=Saccharibacillus kuerlensis TaxID=459527 RepID=A0ABQ2L2H3_9BACL|nr:hypothetical protein [Saccharibacillus kuerlensis]GGO00051.1 hypothetical protein GCM10010969_20840 [Saccharibacillus kuerlensis]